VLPDQPAAPCARLPVVTPTMHAGICQIFENRLKEMNPDQRKITYDIGDLFGFIDKLPDMACLTYATLIAAMPCCCNRACWVRSSRLTYMACCTCADLMMNWLRMSPDRRIGSKLKCLRS